jgi:methylmalonyl-CoA mutase
VVNENDVELNLQKDFPPPSYDEWKQAVIASLKGADFEKAMRTRTYEGITLKPIYCQDDIAGLPQPQSLPGQSPFVRGSSAEGYTQMGWVVAQSQTEPDLDALNAALLDELNRGLNCVNFKLHCATLSGKLPSAQHASLSGVAISHLEDLKAALMGVELSAVPIVIFSNETAIIQLGMLNAYAKATGMPLGKLTGCVSFDPLAASFQTGITASRFEASLDQLFRMTKWADLKAPGIKTLLIDAASYADHGASATQELAYALGTAVCVIDALVQKGLSIEQIAPRFVLRLGLGSNIFMEIAKVRAARMLWAELIKAYQGSEAAQKIWVHGINTSFNKSEFDAWVNLLRSSTESFAGIIGGVDSLEVLPFDAGFNIPDEFARRVARNQQLVLAEEAHLQKVVDPAGGCWYIESLTSELAQMAWKHLQEMESNGGILQAVNSLQIKQEVEAVANARIKNINTRKDVMVGVNMFADPAEIPVPKRGVDPQWLDGAMRRYSNLRGKADPGLADSLKLISEDPQNVFLVDMIADACLHGADIEQLIKALGIDNLTLPQTSLPQAAMHIEALRKAVLAHKSTHPAKIMLLNMGPLAQHKARADFALGFFQSGSFDVIGTLGFETVDTALAECAKTKPPAVCICSTDDTYPELVPAICAGLQTMEQPPVIILAGYPQEMVETYKQAGVRHFIHIRADLYETLKAIAIEMGVQA